MATSTWRRCKQAGHQWDHADRDARNAHAALHASGFGFTEIEEPDPFVGIADYLAEIGPVTWLVHPFVYFGSVTLLAGIWKGGKSTLGADLLRARETGDTWLGQRVPIGPSLLVTEEGGAPVKRKLDGLRKLAILDRRAAAKRGLDFDGVLKRLRDRLLDLHHALVVIDTLAVWADIEDENDATLVTRALSKLGVLAHETEAAIVVVHHTRKEGGTHGRGIRGSGAIPATVDTFAVLDYVEGSPTERTLKLEGRMIEPTELRLDFEDGRYVLVDERVVRLASIEEWLAHVPPDGEGKSRADLMGQWDLPRKATEARIRALIERGRLKRRMGKIGRADGWLHWSIPAVPDFNLLRASGQVERDEEDPSDGDHS